MRMTLNASTRWMLPTRVDQIFLCHKCPLHKIKYVETGRSLLAKLSLDWCKWACYVSLGLSKMRNTLCSRGDMESMGFGGSIWRVVCILLLDVRQCEKARSRFGWFRTELSSSCNRGLLLFLRWPLCRVLESVSGAIWFRIRCCLY